MKRLMAVILMATVIAIPLYSADNTPSDNEAGAVMQKIMEAIKQSNGPVLKGYFEEKIMVSEPDKFARMFRLGKDYDGFSTSSGLLYAVFFDTMKMRSQLRPFVPADHYFCLREVFGKGEPFQMVKDMNTGTYKIAGKYKDLMYFITLRKTGSSYRIITISLPKKK